MIEPEAGRTEPAAGMIEPATPAVAKTPLLRPLAGRRTLHVVPSLALEKSLWDAGDEVVVGMDEVGRGSWAGPLVIGAAIVPKDRRVNGIRDSKMLTEERRETLFPRIAAWCHSWAVGAATQEECDGLGMTAAQRLAAARALDGLDLEADRILVDGNWDFVGRGNTIRVIKGDAASLSVAAASVLAKVSRDRLMRREAEHYPAYDFQYNKGYPCPRHRMALHAYGPTAIHRRSWIFMESLSWGVAGRRVTGRPQGADFSPEE
ncbi:MAG: ribonuclease HII [Acidimicrobiaceae bacterium]|nr:ribonuclease HII [Acidimicrobiaceae bacterium]